MIFPRTSKKKQAVAEAALQYVTANTPILGIGTGSTVEYLIPLLVKCKHYLEAVVASSEKTAQLLKEYKLPLSDLNNFSSLSLYIDGADQINPLLQLIKGKGGALTREKILASVSEKFICIAEENKWAPYFDDKVPIPIEVIPMARSAVARQLVALGGYPIYRPNFVTDNHNIILDTYHLNLEYPVELETTLNNITGVVCHGLFAKRGADIAILATDSGVEIKTSA